MVVPSPNMCERMRGALDFGTMPVELAVVLGAVERRDALDMAEENAGEPKPD
jgi:hypothetical protein